MMILNNEEISAVLSMENCLRFLEKAYQEQAWEPPSIVRAGHVSTCYEQRRGLLFQNHGGRLNSGKVVALRLNSDVIRREERDGRIIKDKIPAAPGNKWVGLIMLFSAETGEPLAIFPDGFIQGLRVAASSARGSMIPGAGVMRLFWGYLVPVGRRGLMRWRDVRDQEIPVHSPTKINRENFAAEVGQELSIPVEAVVSE